MGLETEIKVRLEGPLEQGFRTWLATSQARLVSSRQEEKNILFDFPDERLRRTGCALRVRTYGGRTTMTFKGRLEPDRLLKKRPEFQVDVEQGGALSEILEGLGLQARFQYDKIREIWRIDHEGRGSLEVCIDETPFGRFAEIEGPPDLVESAFNGLGWHEAQSIRDSYVELYRQQGLGSPGKEHGEVNE